MAKTAAREIKNRTRAYAPPSGSLPPRPPNRMSMGPAQEGGRLMGRLGVERRERRWGSGPETGVPRGMRAGRREVQGPGC